jgi:alkaline phosphatase D
MTGTLNRRALLGAPLALAALASLRALAADFPTMAGPLLVPKAPVLDPDLALTRIGIGSCFNQNRDGGLLDVAVKAQPQLFLFMGDNVYGDTEKPDLDELIGAYAAALARPDYRRFREAVPMAAVWDDHDFGQNDGGATYRYRQATQPLFFDFWGIAADHPRRQTGGIYDSFITGPAGARVQVILLDTRSFRDDWRPTDARGLPGRERFIPDPDPGRTILGPAQWTWLETQLLQPAHVRIVVTSYQLLANGHGWESWALFPAERQRFHNLVARTGANGAVLVSGDRHRAGIYRETAGTPYPLYELTSSAINMGHSGAHQEEAGPNRLGPTVSANNVGMVTIDWDRRSLGFEIRDGSANIVLAHQFPIDSLHV